MCQPAISAVDELEPAGAGQKDRSGVPTGDSRVAK
jgi:hypothetical protein